MQITDRQPRPHPGLMWVLMVIVTVIALVVGAVGESVLEPSIAQAVSTAKARVSGAVEALTARTLTPSTSLPKAQSKAPTANAAVPQAQTGSANANAATRQPQEESAPEPYVAVVQKDGPAVVTVVNQMVPQTTLFGQVAQPTALGSGVIIDNQGHIVTNNHVVQGNGKFQVIFSDGRKVPARLVGGDALTDVAVLQVNGAVPAVATFGNSSDIAIGQRVVAIGSALGDFRNTVTHGIISGTDRTLPDSSGPGLSGLIQTDAPINHGNSGGPLLNMQGQVIGLNTAVVRGTGIGGNVAEGLGFAIPSNTVKNIAQELIKNGYVVRPYLGVNWQPVNPQIASYYGLEVNSGALIEAVVPGSPASTAGLQPGDVVTAVDLTKIDQQHDFATLLLNHKIGDTVRLTVRRGHQTLNLSATLGQRPQNSQ